MDSRFESERLREEVSEMKRALTNGSVGEGALFQIEKTLVELRARVKPAGEMNGEGDEGIG